MTISSLRTSPRFSPDPEEFPGTCWWDSAMCSPSFEAGGLIWDPFYIPKLPSLLKLLSVSFMRVRAGDQSVINTSTSVLHKQSFLHTETKPGPETQLKPHRSNIMGSAFQHLEKLEQVWEGAAQKSERSERELGLPGWAQRVARLGINPC